MKYTDATRERDEAMRALAYHDGRSWCAVCGFIHRECNAKQPECLGAKARREFGCTRCEPCKRGDVTHCTRLEMDAKVVSPSAMARMGSGR